MNEVYFKDKGTWLLLDSATSLKGRVCNLRRTKNLEKEVGQRAGKHLEFLFKLWLFTAASQSDLLLLMLWTGCQLSFQALACQGTINHLCLTSSAWSQCFLSTVGTTRGEIKWVKHEYDPLEPPLGAQTPAYAAVAGVAQRHPFFMGGLDLLQQTCGMKKCIAAVLLHKCLLITNIKKFAVN